LSKTQTDKVVAMSVSVEFEDCQRIPIIVLLSYYLIIVIVHSVERVMENCKARYMETLWCVAVIRVWQLVTLNHW
jgi:hypothetical protein